MNGMLTRELLSVRGEQTKADDGTGFIAETLIHSLIFCEQANTLSHLEPSLPNTHIQSNLYLHFTLSLSPPLSSSPTQATAELTTYLYRRSADRQNSVIVFSVALVTIPFSERTARFLFITSIQQRDICLHSVGWILKKCEKAYKKVNALMELGCSYTLKGWELALKSPQIWLKV